MIVISNQSGIARSLITEEQVIAVNSRINELLGEEALIDAFYYCKYHPDYNTPEESECRKPSPLMILRAADELKLDLSKSYMIGDKMIDVIAGHNAGVKTILIFDPSVVSDEKGIKETGLKPNFVAKNFEEACNFILNDYQGEIS